MSKGVRGIAHDLDVAKVTVLGVPDLPGNAARIFEPLSGASIRVDTIVQNASVDRVTDLTFTVSGNDLDKAIEIVEPIARETGARGCVAGPNLGKVSIVGAGLRSGAGYASTMFQALFEAGINIELITTSELRVTTIIGKDRVPEAVRALHRAFALGISEQ